MAWCVISNIVGSDQSETATDLVIDNTILEELLDAALLDITPERQPLVEVRQSACAFLYNLIIAQKYNGIFRQKSNVEEDELPDIVVTLLCGAAEGINDEKDVTTKIRRCLVVGKILFPLSDVELEQETNTEVNVP